MDKKRDCKIVQDLLPNYIEKLTNEETNIFIEEHIKSCRECNEVLNNMKQGYSSNKEVSKSEVDFLKKHKKKIKILKGIILVVVLVYLAFVTKNALIMVSLGAKTNKNLSDNYYVKQTIYNGESIVIGETYNKGNKYLTEMNWYSDKEVENARRVISYNDGNTETTITQINGAIINTANGGGIHFSPMGCTTIDFFANLQYAFIIGIDSAECNGKSCYVINGAGSSRYVDKETGLIVREIENRHDDNVKDIVRDYDYAFNVVKDSDITLSGI